MKAPNNNSCSYNSSWDHVVTFSGAERIGKTATTGQPLHLDAGSSAKNPIVFTATQSDYGLTSSSTLNIAETASGYLQINSGTYNFGYIILGNGSDLTGSLTMNGGTLNIRMNNDTRNYTRLGAGGSTGILTVKAGAVFDNSQATGNGVNMTLGQDSGSTGILNIEGGNVTIAGYLGVNYNLDSQNSALNISDGGVLTVGYMTFSGKVASTVTIDNGTIKAHNDHAKFIPDNSLLAFTVGAGGGTIDNDGYNITIGAAIGGAGGMTFKGSGTTTLSGTPTYRGGTTVEAGTVLSLTAAAKAAIVANSVSVEIPAAGVAAGTTVFEIKDGNGTFTQAEVEAMSITGTDASRYKLALADNDAKVVIADTQEGEYVWNDGDSGASWLTTGKWSKNGVAGDWLNSTAAVFENDGDAATVDADVTAASIEFRANATVSGTAALTVPSITVASGISATISAPVAGPLEKTGAGTLTLSQSRTGVATVLSEGTLAMSGTASLDWSQFTFGTDAEKPVALHMGANATIANIPQKWRIGNVEYLTSTFVKDGGDLTVGNIYLSEKTGAKTSFIQKNGGLLSVGGGIDIGSLSEAHFEIAGGTVTNTAYYIHMSPNSSPADMTVRTGAKYGMSANSLGIIVSGRSHGTLNVSGGDVFANGPLNLCYRGGDATVNVTDGGILAFNKVQYNGGAESDPKGGAAVISIDGGTIRANASDDAFIPGENNLTVTVGANGGTLDANGKNVTVAKAIGGTGGMTYKGGGTVVLSAQPAYSGTTTVELGTTLVVPSAIAGANLVITVPEVLDLATGFYKVVAVSGDGAFSSDVLSAATKPSGLNAHFSLENGGKEIWCNYLADASYHLWIGGSEGSLNDCANWLSGSVPESGTAIIGNPVAAALTNPEGSYFAATTIIVPNGSAPVTISGAKFSGMSKITNNSSSMIEFENAVEFSGNVDVLQNTGIVKFTGGATGTWLARAMDLHGTYTFTGTGDRTELGGTTVKSDGVYKLPNATFYKHNGDFHIEAGGRAEVKAAKINSKDNEKKLLGALNGKFKVTGEFRVSGESSNDWPTHYTCVNGSGVFVANGIRVVQNGYIVPPGKTILGSDGLIRGAGYVRAYNSGSHEFGSYADWTMYHDNLGNTTTDGFVIYKRSSSGTWSTVTFDTTDYYDNTIGRTITSEAMIGAADAASAEKFGVTVKGIGKFVFANTHDDANDAKKIFSGGLTVNDSATVEVMANSCPGTGPVTLNGTSTLLLHTNSIARTGEIVVNDGATLEVAESGTVKLGGELQLKDGATLKFNFTERKVAPVLDLEGKTVTFGDETNITVSVNGSARPVYGSDGKFFLTSGGGFPAPDVTVAKADDCASWVKDVGIDNGDIYAKIAPAGFKVLAL